MFPFVKSKMWDKVFGESYRMRLLCSPTFSPTQNVHTFALQIAEAESTVKHMKVAPFRIIDRLICL